MNEVKIFWRPVINGGHWGGLLGSRSRTSFVGVWTKRWSVWGVLNFYWFWRFDLLQNTLVPNFVGMWGIIFLVSLRLPLIAAETASQPKTWLAGQLVDQTFTDRHLEIQQLMVCVSLVPWTVWKQPKQPRQNWCITHLTKSVSRFEIYISLSVWLRWWHTICTGGVYRMSMGIVHNMQLARASNNFTAGYERMDPSTWSAFKSAMM